MVHQSMSRSYDLDYIHARSHNQPRRVFNRSAEEQLSLKSNATENEYSRHFPSRAEAILQKRTSGMNDSSFKETLRDYKNLKEHRIKWPHMYHRYHLKHGFALTEDDSIVLSARDHVQKTTKGCTRTSGGNVRFSNLDRTRLYLDAEDIVKILQRKTPFNSEPHWKVKQLEFEFKNREGRVGMWAKHDMDFHSFLTCFPRTFEVFGPKNGFVRLVYNNTGVCRVNDNSNMVMVHIARMPYQELRDVPREHCHNQTLPYKIKHAAHDHTFRTQYREKFPPNCHFDSERYPDQRINDDDDYLTREGDMFDDIRSDPPKYRNRPNC